MNFYGLKARIHSEDDYKELLDQNQALQCKLSTKTETLLRLGRDLEKLENEKMNWQTKAATFERNLERTEKELLRMTLAESSTSSLTHDEEKNIQRELIRMKQENEECRRENGELKAEVRDLQKDCKTFRQQLAKFEVERMESNPRVEEENVGQRNKTRMSSDRSNNGEEHLEKYEKLIAKNKQMEIDLKTSLIVKEELVLERETLQKKIERLSAELTYMLNGDPRRVVEDLDSLVAENRYLKAQLDNAQEESETIKATLEKYRTVAEHAQKTPNDKSPTKSEDSTLEEKSSVAVVNMKQIRELLSSNSIELDDGDYRALSNILLDLCNDKQMALAHQRRANKILGNRLHDVEQKLQSLEGKLPRSLSPRNAL